MDLWVWQGIGIGEHLKDCACMKSCWWLTCDEVLDKSETVSITFNNNKTNYWPLCVDLLVTSSLLLLGIIWNMDNKQFHAYYLISTMIENLARLWFFHDNN